MKTVAYIMLLIIAGSIQSGAQHTARRKLCFTPVFGRDSLSMDRGAYAINNGADSLHITTLRFYVSGILLQDKSRIIWREPKSFHLIDAAEPAQLQILLQIPPDLVYDQLVFQLGIDSATNAAGAQDGDLDATKGMYWAWQSGYINLKLEGNSPVCKTRKHEFQFHLGGFREGELCVQTIALKVPAGKDICIGVDVARFFSGIDLATQNNVTTPGAAAITISRKAADMFFILPGS